MQPANLPLDLYRGDTLHLQVNLWDQNNNALNLAGAVAKSEIRDRPAGTAIIVAMTCVITLPNIVNLTLAAADCHKLPPQCVWDLELTYASGDVQTPVGGQVTVTVDVTNSTP